MQTSLLAALYMLVFISGAHADNICHGRHKRPELHVRPGDQSDLWEEDWQCQQPDEFGEIKRIFNYNENSRKATIDIPEEIEIDLGQFREILIKAAFLRSDALLEHLVLADNPLGSHIRQGIAKHLGTLGTITDTDAGNSTYRWESASEECVMDMNRQFEPITNPLVLEIYYRACARGWLGWRDCNDVARAYMERVYAPVSMTSWGLIMFDAFGKPGPGISGGNLHMAGDYDMCLGVEGQYTEESGNRTVKGKYCRVAFNRAPVPGQPYTGLFPMGLNLNLGVCVQDSCSDDGVVDYLLTVNTLTAGLFSATGMTVMNRFCGHDLDLATDTDALVTSAIVLILICIVASATVYDAFCRPHIYRQYMPRDTLKIDPRVHCLPAQPDLTKVIENGNEKEKSKIYVTQRSLEKPPIHTQVSSASFATFQSSVLENEDIINYEPITTLQRAEVLFVGFSAYSNLRRIFRHKRPDGWMGSIDGLRVLTAIWMLFGYTFALGTLSTETFTTMNLLPRMTEWIKTAWFQLVVNFHFGGDTYLVITGCLITYWWLVNVSKNQHTITARMMVMFYAHRYWRLVPTLLFIVLFYATMYQYLAEGPLVPPEITDAENCKDNWWLSVFLVQNLFKKEYQCLSWSWFVAVAYQLHIITPLLLIPLTLKPVIAYIMWAVLMVVHLVASTLVTVDTLPSGFQDMSVRPFYRNHAQAPWCRIGGYLIGIAVGDALYRLKCKLNINKLLNVCLWLLSGVLMMLPVFITHQMFNNGLWNEEETAAFYVLGRISFSLGVAWVILACETGNGGVINTFLSWGAWRSLAPVMFVLLIVAPVLCQRVMYNRRQTLYLEIVSMIYQWTGNIFTIFCIALGVTVLLEHPLKNASKAFFSRTKTEAIMAGNHRKVHYNAAT